MQHALDSHLAIEHTEENHIAPQGCHARARGQILTADIAQRCAADSSALFDQLGDKTPGVDPAVLGDVIADVERLPLVLVADLPLGSA
jgi:hypothetical protein